MTKTVSVKWTIMFPMDVPAHWNKEQIEFYFNESSWCMGNFLDELNEYAKQHEGCICNICEAEVIGDTV